MTISASLRRQVIERAENRCEYCGLAQTGQEAAFHIDHIVPVSGGGGTNLENLALACVSCSLRKGARLLTRDPSKSFFAGPNFSTSAVDLSTVDRPAAC